MRDEIAAANPATRVRIGGVNAANASSGNGLMTDGRDLPWCQDVADAGDGAAWTAWGVVNRDVVVLDRANGRVAVYNLTVHDLSVPANYAELLGILRAAAGE